MDPDDNELQRKVHNLEQRVRELERRLEMEVPEPAPADAPLAPVLRSVPPPIPIRDRAKVLPRREREGATVNTPQTPIPPRERPQAAASATHFRPPPVARPSPSPGPRPTPVADFLRKIYILPPKAEPGEGGNLEQQLAAWWMTRIGGLLAVIALVFLGLYVSRYSSPLVRVIQLLAISGGVFGLGLFLERRTPQFGRVLVAVGLAMFFFTAFAMYAIDALKVVHQSGMAAVLQILAVLVVFGVAWWKNSQHLATMAVGFSGITQITGLIEGLSGLSMSGSIILTLLAGGLYALRRWSVPLLASVVLLILIHGLLLGFEPPRSWTLATWGIWLGVLAVPILLVTAVDCWHRSRGYLETKGWRYALQTVTLGGISSTAVLLAWGLDQNMTPHQNWAERVCWLFGGLLIGIGLWYRIRSAASLGYRRVESNLAAMPFIKGSALIALGFMIGFDGAARWMALLLQSAIMVYSAWRGRLKLLTVLVLAIWVAAALAFVFHFAQTPMPARDAWLRILFVLGSAATLAATWRFAPRLFEAQGLVMGALLGLVIIPATGMTGLSGWYTPTAFLIGAAAFGVAIKWSPSQAVATLVPVAAFCILHFFNNSGLSNGQQLAAGCSVLAMLLPVTLAVRESKAPLAIVFFLMLAVWSVLTNRLCLPELAFLIAALSGGVVLRIGKAFQNPIISWQAIVPLAFAVLHGYDGWTTRDLNVWGMMIATAAAYGFAVFSNHYWPQRTERRWLHALPALAVAVLAIWTFDYIFPSADSTNFAFVGLAVAALVFAGCGWWSLLHAAALLGFGLFGFVSGRPGEANWIGFLPLFVLAFGLAVVAWKQMRNTTAQPALKFWVVAMSVCALAIAVFFFLDPELQPITTIGWGAAALLLVLGGLYFRSVQMRLVGFGGLALAIGRVFAVDVKDTFHRIIAFAVLAVVFLVLGYLYTRFRSVIADDVSKEA